MDVISRLSRLLVSVLPVSSRTRPWFPPLEDPVCWEKEPGAGHWETGMAMLGRLERDTSAFSKHLFKRQ